ncbi:hypothetical protein BKA61DRAFT_731786 [Leptodontidium sp. MPI-SDFR-AT-0119]|nr:hypothetical protein BKA61DRAFT_731786 [Leptodontidium sp. MPI-SDFR-AT-0119]
MSVTEIIYRQMANILLELAAHDFPRVGSSSRIDHDTCVDSRPLKLKMNETERHGGDNTSSRPSPLPPNTFITLLNKICSIFASSPTLSTTSMTLIVAVVDWEWAYAAPYQMLYSPPRWLLIKKPIRWNNEDSPITYLSQYKSYFQKFVRILEDEESKRARDVAPPPASKDERMSSLLQQSMDDGKFWYHELVYSSFESADNPAWAAIRGIIPNLNDLATVTDTELNAFVEGKMEQLRQYDLEWGIMKEDIDKKNAQFEALKEKVGGEIQGMEKDLTQKIGGSRLQVVKDSKNMLRIQGAGGTCSVRQRSQN